MKIIIDPMNLTDQHKTLLSLLLKQSKDNIGVFERGEYYKVTPTRTSKNIAAETVDISLTHTIYKRPREKHPKQFRYDIIDETPGTAIEENDHSAIHKVMGTLKPVHNTLKLDTENNHRLAKVETFYKKKETTHPRPQWRD